jgi:hypothetical protein
MFHTRDGLRLTPAYDLVAAALYPEYRHIALALGNASNLELGSLGPKHIVGLKPDAAFQKHRRGIEGLARRNIYSVEKSPMAPS